jgi:acyl dehydratase
MIAADTFQPGAELPVVSKHISRDLMRLFSGFQNASSIHTSEEFARSRGLAAPVVPGLQLYAFICQSLQTMFGASWFTTGELEVSFLHGAVVGDTVTVRGAVTGAEILQEGQAVTVDVWCENQEGIKLAVGTAKVTVGSGPT